MTCLFDCCHSGTVLDLPYVFIGDGDHEEMEVPEKFNFSTIAAAVAPNAAEFVDDDDKPPQTSQSSPASGGGGKEQKRNPLLCCCGGKPEDSDDDFDDDDGTGKPPGHRKVIVIGLSLPFSLFFFGDHFFKWDPF